MEAGACVPSEQARSVIRHRRSRRSMGWAALAAAGALLPACTIETDPAPVPPAEVAQASTTVEARGALQSLPTLSADPGRAERTRLVESADAVFYNAPSATETL